MHYFKNTDLAKLYNVSEKTVRNWIQAASTGKLALQLVEADGRQYIANIIRNTTLIEMLVEKNKKFTNSRGYKSIAPTPDFYKIYTAKEIFDIVSSLDIYREMPHSYSYFNDGAADWDLYVQKLAQENSTNILSNTVSLLELSKPYLDDLLENYSKVNLIDIGPGNAYPVNGLLAHFLKAGKLGRYIGIDISQDMLNIAKRNIRTWFGDQVSFEGYVRDANYERFEDLLAPDSFGKDSSVANVVLYLGSTIANFRKPNQSLATIHESMGKNDVLLLSRSLDTARVRRYFDFITDDTSGGSRLSSLDGFVLNQLITDDSLYEVEQFFDEQKMARKIQVRLKVALSIEFQLNHKPKVINFNKDETILLWQHKHQDLLGVIGQLDENGFDILGAAKSTDQETMLAVAKIKTSY